MKKWLTIACFGLLTGLKAQNEFAATAFYNELKKISADAQNGFVLSKGARKAAAFEEFAEEFNVNLHLMLADSGKIVFPKNGNPPYAIYYFEPAKFRLKTDQRGADLRDAIVTAFSKPLYARTESTLVNEKAYTDTYIYQNQTDTEKRSALFRISVYPEGNKYFLSLEIRGKAVAAPSTVPVP